jgi:FAD/FMN-containing dehydrogenase
MYPTKPKSSFSILETQAQWTRRSLTYVVLPKSVEEVQAILHLANRERIPVVPLGGELVLSGLSRPLKGEFDAPRNILRNRTKITFT